MKKINTNQQRTKKMSVIAILLLMAIIITSFVMARFNGRSNQETQEFIESLIAENENNPEAVKYLITDNCISRVYPETELETFVTNFSEGEEVKVYTNSECTEEVTDGFVVSGMYAKYMENGRKYEISVLGDINEKTSKTEGGAVLVGDGILNQIELTRDIRSCVDEEWKIDEEVEKKSGDVNCENQIDELSVKTIIDYIVYGDLNVDEVGLVAKPTVEVISGDLNEKTVYTSNVKIRITENEENALKTVYKITGDSVQGYKIAVNGEEVYLTENGIYKITAYTYGKLENKSKREYVIINIDKTANYTMEYYLEGENGEYSKVEEGTEVVEGEIGQTVGIEQKEFTDYELDVDNVNGKLQGEVLEDGSLVLKAYYNRKSFTYTFETGENITGITAQKVTSTDGQGTTPAEPASTVSVTAKWGEKININAVVATEPGYTITWKEWVNKEDTTDKIPEQETQITVGKENKTYKPTATKTLIDYTIAYELNGGALPTGATNKTEYTVETESFTLNNPSKAGYEFKGWTGGTVNTQGQIDNTIPAGSTENVSTPTTTLTVNSGSLGNRKYTANWEAITNTPYKVEHYKETLKTGEFTLAEEENKGGTTDTEATATPKTYKGFTYDSTNENEVKSGTITANGELVLKLYYTRNTYDLTIVAGNYITNINAEGEAIETGKEGPSTVGKHQTTSETTLKYKYEQGVTLGTTRENKEGYTYQNITWESSNADKIANSTETTNEQTATKEITMPAANITITAKVERAAKIYTITYNLNGGALPQGVTNPSTYTIENSDITINNLKDGTVLGYDFAGWTGSNGTTPSKNVVIAHGSTGDKTYTANWTEAIFNYTVEYYYEVANGYEIDASLTEHKTAKYNAEVSQFTDNEKTGYQLKEEPSTLKISYDENLNVLKVYYIKKQHTLTLQKDDNIASVTGFGIYKYGDRVEISAVLKEIDGYEITWNKWVPQLQAIEDSTSQTTKITIPDEDVTLEATSNKVAIEYGISYMLNGGVMPLVDETNPEGERQENPAKYTIESDNITLINPEKQGYVFAGWTGGTNKTNPGISGNVENPTTTLTIATGSMGTRLYTANWIGDVRTPYTVEHYKENLDGTYGTTPANTDTEEGTTDEEAIASERTYEGFEVDRENVNNVLKGTIQADGSLVLKVYYKRKVSTIGFVAGNNIEKVSYSVKDGVGAVAGTSNSAEGTNLSGEFKYGTQINIAATIEEETGHTTTWSAWESSATDKIVNQATQEALIGVPTGNVTLTAKATRTTNKYNYKVEYYYDNVIDNSKTVENEATYGSRISSYTNKNITGFELQEEVNKPLTITENESANVMKIYYKHINYSITYDLAGGQMPLADGTNPEGERQENPETYSVLSQTFTLINPEKAGYNFLGWTGTNGNEPNTTVTIAQGSTGNKNYTANWRAKTDTLYTIEHYKEGLDGTYAKVEADTEEAYGTTGTEVTTQGKIKTYTGFTHDENNENAVESGTVSGDGSLVLKVYYKRNEYTLNLVAGDNIENVKYTITNAHGIAEGYDLTQTGTNIEAKFKYGAGLSIQATLVTEENYNITNGKWTSNSTKVRPTNVIAEIVIPDENVTLTASATKTGKPYTYYTNYYYENGLEHTSSSTAAYNTQVTNYTPRAKTGYKFSEVVGTPLTITENTEANVINVYYVLENYTLSYELSGGQMPLVNDAEPEGERQQNPTSYNVTTPTFNIINPEKEGFIFTGWSGTGLTGNENTTVTIEQGSTGNREYTANWQASTDTEYKVEYYIENLNSTEDPASEEVNEANYTKYTAQGLQETYIGTTGETATATPIDITGFTYNEGKSRNTITGTIAANGSLVLKVFYTRNSYKLKLVVGDDNISSVSNGGDVSTTEIEKSYKYGKTVSIGAATATITGYTPRFDKWVSSNTTLMSNKNDRITTVTIPAGDVTLTATGAREKAKFTYTVEYYYENAAGEMVKDDEKTVTGEPTEYESQILTYAEKQEAGYELYRVETLPLVITATPANNVIKVYYRLINYNLIYDLANGKMPLVNEEEPEGERQTNPVTYTTKTENFTLINPVREGYIFTGWTGGVVNAEQELDSKAETGTTANVTRPTRTLTIEKGSLGNRKYTANWQERTYEVIVHHYLQGTGTNEVAAVKVAEDEIYSTTTLGAEYTVKDLIPTYNEQGEITNPDASERNYLDGREFRVVGNSGNTTGAYTRDPIEVIFYYQYYPVVKIVSSPASTLNGTEYITIEEALAALSSAGQTVSSDLSKLQILRNVKDETVVVNNLNIELDLNDYTVNSNAEVPTEGENPKAEPAIKLTNSKLTLVDGSEYSRGKVTSQNGSGVYVDVNSTFTLGIEERPVEQFPQIIAKTNGVEKQTIGEGVNQQQGTFNFFDGKITGKNAVLGNTDLTPLLYSATNTVNENGDQVSILGIITGKEARIGRQTYGLLEDAISAASTSGEQVEIVLLKDITREQRVIIPYNKNIKLDLDGYTMSTTIADYVLENRGKLEIVDSSATEENIYGNGKITSTTNSTVLNAIGVGKEIGNYSYENMITSPINGFSATNEGKIISNNQGASSTTAHAYLVIDLTDEQYLNKQYILSVNAEVSSEEQYDFGYATITNNATMPAYNNETGRFICIAGTQQAKTYSTTLAGGQQYYLHFGYRKDGSGNTGTDTFTINNIEFGEAVIGELTHTSGRIQIECSGSSSEYKQAIKNDGNLYIGSSDETYPYKPYLYSGNSYTQVVNGKGNVVVNDVYIDSYARGIQASGNITINNGTFKTSDVSLGHNQNSTPGTTAIINGGTYNREVYNWSAEKMIINGGTLSSYLHMNSDYNPELEINGGKIDWLNCSKAARTTINNGEVRIIYTNGELVINDGKFDSITNQGGTIIVNGGTISRDIDNRSSGETITVNDGAIGCITNAYDGTVNIFNGNIGYISNATYSSSKTGTTNIYGGNFIYSGNVITNKGHGTVNIYDGTFEGTSTNYNTVKNDESGVINIYAGTISNISTYACVYNNTGTINIGNKDDETVGNNTPVILGTLGYGACNEVGTMNFYDGIIKGKVNQSVWGKINEIPDGVQVLISYEGDNNEIEVSTLGIPSRPVAQIGDTTYTTLQSAIDACPDNTETTIKMIDKEYLSRGTTVNENKNIIIDLNSNEIISLAESPAIKNEGNIELTDNSRVSQDIDFSTKVDGTLGFDVLDGKLVSTNHNNNTTSNTYLPIDLTAYAGKKVMVKVNANVSSKSYSAYGYATIKQNTTVPSYNTTDGRFIYISGEYPNIDYITELDGGKVYYLHLGYHRSSETAGTDEFTVNKVSFMTKPGKIQSKGGVILENNGTSKIETICMERMNTNGTVVSNNNTMVIDGAMINADNGEYNTIIDNAENANLTINSGRFIGGIRNTAVIKNQSANEVLIKNAYIEGRTCILNDNGGNIRLQDNYVYATYSYSYKTDAAINNKNGNVVIDSGVYREQTSSNGRVIYSKKGNITVKDGMINYGDYGVYLDGETTLTIENGTFKGSSTAIYAPNSKSEIIIQNGNFKECSLAIYLPTTGAKATITGGTFNTTAGSIYCSSNSTVTISNANITSTGSYAIYNTQGNISLLSGTYTSTYNQEKYTGSGVYNQATLTLGEDDGIASKTSPAISGIGYGVYNSGSNATCYFYDGILEGKDGQAFYGNMIQAEDYNIIKETVTKQINGVDKVRQIAYLDSLDVAQVGTEKFKNLKSAIEYCTDNEHKTIELLRDITIAGTDAALQIPEGKDITLDLKGLKIAASNTTTFENSGKFEVIDTGRISEEDNETVIYGEIRNTIGCLFTNINEGDLILTSGSIITTAEKYTLNNESVVCYPLRNEGIGTITINGATVKGEGGIINKSSGEILILAGSVTSESDRVCIYSTGENGKVTVRGGSVYGHTGVNSTNGTVTVEGGTVRGSSYAVHMEETSKLFISGGTLDGGSDSIYLEDTSELQMSDGTVKDGIIMRDSSKAKITGGTITDSGKNFDIFNAASIEITGGTFNSSGYNIDNGLFTQRTGIVSKISGGTFTTTGNTSIYNSDYYDTGRLEITGGTFTAKLTENSDAVIVNKGNMLITGATITGYNGIINQDKGKLTLGEDDNTIDNNSISINAQNIGVQTLGTNDIFNYYDGTITAKEIITGVVADMPDENRVTTVTEDDLLVATVKPFANIARIEGKGEYTSLQDAINAAGTETTTIEITDTFITSDIELAQIESNQNITIDLKGFRIENHGSMIDNAGTFKIIDLSTENTGIIKGYSMNLINNTGYLELNCNIEQSRSNKIIDNSGTGSVIIHGGNIKTVDNRYYTSAIVNTSSSGNIVVEDGTFTTQTLYNASNSGKNSYFIYNTGSGDITIYDGTIEMYTAYETTAYGIYSNNSDSTNRCQIAISGGNMTYQRDYTLYAIYTENNTDIEITGGNIFTMYGINNKGGYLKINGDDVVIDAYYYALRNEQNSTVDIIKGKLNSRYSSRKNSYEAISNMGTLNISGGEITAEDRGIYNHSYGTVTITGGSISGRNYGFYNWGGKVTFIDGEIRATKENDESIYAVYLTYTGTFNMGEKAYPVSRTNPRITSTSYGVYRDNGIFNFYDGIITGNTKALYGEVADKPELYSVIISDDEKTATLEIRTEFEQVAEMNNMSFDSVQQAITSAGTTAQTILLQKDVVISEKLTIAANQNITIDLQGHSIAIPDGDYAIMNNGTLTIIDTVLTDTTSEATSIIENKVVTGNGPAGTGAAIYNAAGATLTLGIEDTTVHPCVPTIIGNKNAIENYGIFNMFDGCLKAKNATLGGSVTAFNVPNGYTYSEVTEGEGADAIKVLTLVAQ